MTDRDTIIDFIDDYLAVDDYDDYGPQGLQVAGRNEVETIVTGVSASVALFEQALDLAADLILVHHGVFWDKDPRTLVGGRRERIRLLLCNDLNLAAYHLCLDAHSDIGNNALGAHRLGLGELEPWAEVAGKPIGFRGRWSPALSVDEAVERINRTYGTEALVFRSGPDPVTTVGLISGGAQRELRTAVELGLDMFITGEVSEFVMHEAQEARIHFVSAGHYHTETLGIRALGDLVASRFGVDHHFVDLPNPV